jgi:hypothetical protein
MNAAIKDLASTLKHKPALIVPNGNKKAIKASNKQSNKKP